MAWSDVGKVFDPAGIVTKKKASWAPDPLGLSQDPSLAPQVADQGYGQMLQQLREAGPTTAQQQALTSNLVGAVYGNGPSVAQNMAAGLNAQGQRQALGNAAAGVSGGNSSLALRTGQQVAGNMSQQAAGQMGALRAQEIQGARGQALQNQANSTQAQMGALAGVQGIADKNLALQQEQLSGAQNRLGEAGASVMKMSDERAKHDIHPESGHAIEAFLQSVGKPVSYEYNGSDRPEHGSIAQDVERGGPIGKGIVVDMGGLKGLDIPRAVEALMQAVGHLNRKVNARG